MECPKVQCVHDERRIGEQMSRLESLPENLLLHILSFLSTEDAVKTSILSKSLQYSWTSVPSLTFSFPMVSKSRSKLIFRNFVERVLMLRDFSTLQQFSLSFKVDVRVSSWITAAVRRRVQEIYLRFNFPTKRILNLPSCLFSCETLRVFDLEAYFNVKLPPIHLPSLKKMRLLKLRFSDDDSTEKVFSGCPLLEELIMEGCVLNELKSVEISCPQLQVLSIHDHREEENCPVAQVTIFAPNLKSFAYEGEFFHSFCLSNSSSLVDANFDFDFEDYLEELINYRENAYRAYKLLGSFLTLERLEISFGTLEMLEYAKEYIVNLPMFVNLTSLEIPAVVNFDRPPVLELLQHMPHLTNIGFLGGFGLDSECLEVVWKVWTVPQCFMSHLETVKLSCYHGAEDEVLLIKLLLQDAVVLKTLTINYDRYEYHIYRMVEEELQSFPRGSPSCRIIINGVCP